jgi:hypothetical protein
MLSHIHMLYDQSQCAVLSFGAYPSVCGAASDLPNLVGSHNQMEDLLFSYTSSQCPLTIRLSHGYEYHRGNQVTGLTGTVKVSRLTTHCRTMDLCGSVVGMLGFIQSFGDLLT